MVCILSGCGDTILQDARLSMALAPESGYCESGYYGGYSTCYNSVGLFEVMSTELFVSCLVYVNYCNTLIVRQLIQCYYGDY